MTKIFVQATKRNNELFGESCRLVCVNVEKADTVATIIDKLSNDLGLDMVNDWKLQAVFSTANIDLVKYLGKTCTVESTALTSPERPNPDGKMLWNIAFRDGTELVAFEDEICL